MYRLGGPDSSARARATKSGLGTTVQKLVLGMCRHLAGANEGALRVTGERRPEGTRITTTCQLFGEDRKLSVPSRNPVRDVPLTSVGRVSRPTKVLQ